MRFEGGLRVLELGRPSLSMASLSSTSRRSFSSSISSSRSPCLTVDPSSTSSRLIMPSTSEPTVTRPRERSSRLHPRCVQPPQKPAGDLDGENFGLFRGARTVAELWVFLTPHHSTTATMIPITSATISFVLIKKPLGAVNH